MLGSASLLFSGAFIDCCSCPLHLFSSCGGRRTPCVFVQILSSRSARDCRFLFQVQGRPRSCPSEKLYPGENASFICRCCHLGGESFGYTCQTDSVNSQLSGSLELTERVRYSRVRIRQPSRNCFCTQGHEHDCHTELRQSQEGRCQILQPGSSIATSLTPGEAQQKHVFVLEVRQAELRDLTFQRVSLNVQGSFTKRVSPSVTRQTVVSPKASHAELITHFRQAWS